MNNSCPQHIGQQQVNHLHSEQQLAKSVTELQQCMIDEIRDTKMMQPAVNNVLYSICIVFDLKPNPDGV